MILGYIRSSFRVKLTYLSFDVMKRSIGQGDVWQTDCMILIYATRFPGFRRNSFSTESTCFRSTAGIAKQGEIVLTLIKMRLTCRRLINVQTRAFPYDDYSEAAATRRSANCTERSERLACLPTFSKISPSMACHVFS